jgi:hypothetical protein
LKAFVSDKTLYTGEDTQGRELKINPKTTLIRGHLIRKSKLNVPLVRV